MFIVFIYVLLSKQLNKYISVTKSHDKFLCTIMGEYEGLKNRSLYVLKNIESLCMIADKNIVSR